MDPTVTIQATKNGPYLINGALTLKDGDGNTVPTKTERIALCRCGGSANKPFCDGTHKKVNFQAN
jgi:3-phenylpropionate/trans-cinnamate dioxygenase ferredoxin subunit